MKKGIITMMMLMLGMSGMMAQTVVCTGSGDVTLRQGDVMVITREGEPITFDNDEKITLSSYKDYDVTIPTLCNLKVMGAGDVESKGKLEFPYLDILIAGIGDANLTVECDTIKATLIGIGDLNLNGHCHYLEATVRGLGDLNIEHFIADSLSITRTRVEGSSSWPSRGNNGSGTYHSLLFSPHWDGFEAGLNMLLGPGPNAEFTNEYTLLEQRPLKSWNFNFNIASVGLAFTHTHRVGVYTGIGFGWNNYSFNNPVRLEKGQDKLICNYIDETVEGQVKKSKLGVLYLQAPLMIEVRPTSRSYIALGVTGGLRIDTWTKVKYRNGVKVKTHNDYYLNRFKLDASLRAGGDFLGFYANFNLLPLFAQGKAQDAHCLSFGLSLNF